MKKETLTERIDELEIAHHVFKMHAQARIDALETAITELCGGQETRKGKEVYLSMYQTMEMSYKEMREGAPEHIKQTLNSHLTPIWHDLFTRIHHLKSDLSE